MVTGLPTADSLIASIATLRRKLATEEVGFRNTIFNSTSTDTTTGPPPKPIARSVAISRVRAETAVYIVFNAPKIAPIPIRPAISIPTPVTRLWTIEACSA